MTPQEQIGWNYFHREWDIAKLKERFDAMVRKPTTKQEALVRLRAWCRMVRRRDEIERN